MDKKVLDRFPGWQDPGDLGGYLADLWHGCNVSCNENVKVRSKAYGDSRYLRLLCKNGVPSELEFMRLAAGSQCYDRYFHPNTLVPCGRRSGKAGKNATFKVYAFAIDVDPIHNMGSGNDVPDICAGDGPLRAALALLHGCFEEECLPWPNYIEYGRNFRLIYILDKPVYARSPQGQNILKKIERFQRHVADIINRCEPRMHASAQGYETGFRVPGSMNGKNAAVIRIEKVRDRFLPFEELFDYLPDAISKETFQARKRAFQRALARKSRKAGKAARTRAYAAWCRTKAWAAHIAPDFALPKLAGGIKLPIASALLRRLIALKEARNLPGILREVTTFAYLATWDQLFGSPDDTLALAAEFNEGFDCPMPENELRQKLSRLYGHYRLSNAWIETHTGIPAEFLAGHRPAIPCVSHPRGEAEAAKQCRLHTQGAGPYKVQQQKKAPVKRGRKPIGGDFDACFAAGMGARETAKKLGCSKRTAYRRLAAWETDRTRREAARAMEAARLQAAQAEANAKATAGRQPKLEGVHEKVPRFGIHWDCRDRREETDWKTILSLRRMLEEREKREAAARGQTAPA